MSASLCRCLRQSGRNLAKIKNTVYNGHKRYCSESSSAFFVHENTVPYFPDRHRMKSLEAEYPEVEISTEDFKYVERLMPSPTVPPVPKHDSYPTPSGWVPPNPKIQPKLYTVGRSRYHQLPVYLEQFFSGRITTKVSHVNGDIWKCHEDLKAYMTDQGYTDLRYQVHEVGRFIRIRGNYVTDVAQFCLKNGF